MRDGAPPADAPGICGPTVALLTRDRNGLAPIGQLLVCPMLDDRNDTFSGHQKIGRASCRERV